MLARRLGLELPAVAPVVTNRVADWCAHEFQASRCRYLLFFNTASLYPVLARGRGVTDGRRLIGCLADSVRLHLLGTELERHYQQWIAPELAAVQWAPIPGKSVLGSMNDLIDMAKYHLEFRGESLPDLSRKLAESPMGMLGMNSPERAFRKLGS